MGRLMDALRTISVEDAAKAVKEAAALAFSASERLRKAKAELDAAEYASQEASDILRRANKALVMAAGGVVPNGL